MMHLINLYLFGGGRMEAGSPKANIFEAAKAAEKVGPKDFRTIAVEVREDKIVGLDCIKH